MKAALCKRLEGPSGIEIVDLPDPVPGPGEVVVLVSGVGLNHFDTLIVRGRYQTKPELPFSPGGEIAGTIARLGPDVAGFKVGERVAAYIGHGGARQQAIVPAAALIPIPAAVPDTVAAGVCITYGTAMHALQDRGRLLRGETVAVIGASGGAGLAAIETAKLLGARVIAVSSSQSKLALAREHGADEAVASIGAGLKETLRALTDGRGVDVVYDCVGGETAEPALRGLAWGGRFLVVGFAGGEIPSIRLNLVLVKGISVIGVHWGPSVARDLQRHRENVMTILQSVAAGALRPRIHAVYPLAQISDALGVLDRREALGKIILDPAGNH